MTSAEHSSSEHPSAVTDRARLVGHAYRDARDLAARQALYAHQTPRHDLPGLVAGQLAGVRGWLADVGCGNGLFLERLRREHRVLGLDLSPGILTGLPGPVGVADAVQLPLADRSLGGAIAMHMLYHVPDVWAAVGELARVVEEGGVVIVSTNGRADKAELGELWRRAAGEVTGTAPPPVSLGARFTLEDAPGLLGEWFGEVEVVRLPGVIRVVEPEPVVAYLASYRAWADELGVPFGETVARVRELLVGEGEFVVRTEAGVVVCRV
ncbi:class I SAM-dependent methyltransferase [Streptomyces sp. NPDC004539]|uniref:class I SAM-dependent methyltransferase n=1 Tax=Streptomyces sp. NPDC004539 TaxID=3154280 RepID=UPI0033A7152D